jgi:MOSC domain-containing protein YiiM
MIAPAPPQIVSVSARNGHGLGKTVCDAITLIAGEGVEGDAHRGFTVKHRSRVAKDPTQPNVRQVHLIQVELLDEVAAKGFTVKPGEMGENILTRGIDLLGLATGARLYIGADSVVEITGLRNPCKQLNGHSEGLMAALLERAGDGALIRKGGVMGIVLAGGEVRAGDGVKIVRPDGPFCPLEPV